MSGQAGYPAPAGQHVAVGPGSAPEVTPQPQVVEKKPKAPVLALPPVREIDQALKILIGDKVGVAEVSSKKGPALEDMVSGYFVSRVSDDEGKVVGLLLADLKATIYLGGGLMMVPQSSMAEQVRAGKASEEVVDALSEIFNNVCALINKIKNNTHVRASTAEPFDPTSESWISSPSARRDMEDSYGGRMIMVIR